MPMGLFAVDMIDLFFFSAIIQLIRAPMAPMECLEFIVGGCRQGGEVSFYLPFFMSQRYIVTKRHLSDDYWIFIHPKARVTSDSQTV